MLSLNWLADNWFTLLQSLGIISAIFFTGISSRRDAKGRRVTNRFEVTRHHREIWTLLYERNDLKRVMASDADLITHPVTDEERIFVNLLILHLANSYHAAKAGMFALPSGLQADAKAFFSRPIPRAVWERMRALQDPEFANFVERQK
jgi:hypothetical protein